MTTNDNYLNNMLLLKTQKTPKHYILVFVYSLKGKKFQIVQFNISSYSLEMIFLKNLFTLELAIRE